MGHAMIPFSIDGMMRAAAHPDYSRSIALASLYLRLTDGRCLYLYLEPFNALSDAALLIETLDAIVADLAILDTSNDCRSFFSYRRNRR